MTTWEVPVKKEARTKRRKKILSLTPGDSRVAAQAIGMRQREASGQSCNPKSHTCKRYKINSCLRIFHGKFKYEVQRERVIESTHRERRMHARLHARPPSWRISP